MNDAMKFENYRPILVLVCYSKLLERLAIIDFVDKITKAIADEGK
jgi:hypothetical protein